MAKCVYTVVTARGHECSSHDGENSFLYITKNGNAHKISAPLINSTLTGDSNFLSFLFGIFNFISLKYKKKTSNLSPTLPHTPPGDMCFSLFPNIVHIIGFYCMQTDALLIFSRLLSVFIYDPVYV